jgi:type IV secretion system protein TrbL
LSTRQGFARWQGVLIMRTHRHLFFLGVSLTSSLAFASEVAAQTTGCGIGDGINALDCVLSTFQTATRGWEASLSQLAFRLFWILALIEFAWGAMLLAFRGADISEWMSSLLNQILFLGFFAALLQFSSTWAAAIVDSFRGAANIAGGVAVIRPSDIFDAGLKLASTLLADLSVLSPVFSLVLVLSSFFLLIAFGLIAATLIVALVESFIIISAGVLMMGFGGSRWTKDYAVRTFQYCLSVGAKLFIVQLMAGLMIAIIQPWTTVDSAQLTQSWTFLLVPLGISIVFVVLIRTIPELVQGIINGTSLASGAGLYAAATGFAAGAAANTYSAGMAATSAGQLASEQLTGAALRGEAPVSRAGHLAWLGVRAAANLGDAAVMNVGDRLSGRVPPHGTRMGQMSAAIERTRDAQVKQRIEGAHAAKADPVHPGPPKPANDH